MISRQRPPQGRHVHVRRIIAKAFCLPAFQGRIGGNLDGGIDGLQVAVLVPAALPAHMFRRLHRQLNAWLMIRRWKNDNAAPAQFLQDGE